MGLYDGFGEGVSLGGQTEQEVISKAIKGSATASRLGQRMRNGWSLRRKAAARGFKAAGNKQSTVGGAGGASYTAGAVARHAAAPAAIGGAASAGYKAAQFKDQRQKAREEDVWKSDSGSFWS